MGMAFYIPIPSHSHSQFCDYSHSHAVDRNIIHLLAIYVKKQVYCVSKKVQDFNSRVSWSIFAILLRLESGINILQSFMIYDLMA